MAKSPRTRTPKPTPDAGVAPRTAATDVLIAHAHAALAADALMGYGEVSDVLCLQLLQELPGNCAEVLNGQPCQQQHALLRHSKVLDDMSLRFGALARAYSSLASTLQQLHDQLPHVST